MPEQTYIKTCICRCYHKNFSTVYTLSRFNHFSKKSLFIRYKTAVNIFLILSSTVVFEINFKFKWYFKTIHAIRAWSMTHHICITNNKHRKLAAKRPFPHMHTHTHLNKNNNKQCLVVTEIETEIVENIRHTYIVNIYFLHECVCT